MSKNFEVKINNKKYKACADQTILQLAKTNKLWIPTLCHHSDLKPNANCRLCLVEIINGKDSKVVTACNTEVTNKMEIKLDSPKVKKIRRLNLELLLSDHIKKCPECDWRDNCQLKNLATEFNIKDVEFEPRRRKFKEDKKTPSLFWDSSKCIECGNCISACEEITGLEEIETKYKGHSIIFGPRGGKSFVETNCVNCGQCIAHCPAGSLQENSQKDEIAKLLKNKKGKILVAQFAPSTRYSIGELYGCEPGENLELKLITALKQIGFDYVFDINAGADITTIEEATELIARLGTKSEMPMFTSCCPAWVKYVETFYHELIPNLTTTKSPAQCLAAAIRAYFAKKNRINQKKIIIVEIMPCVAKKYEISLPEVNRNYHPEVNYSLTVREAARLLKDNDIDLPKLDDNNFDQSLSQSSGAATIYGSSGGVMESALRTAVAKIERNDLGKIDFKEVRGMTGIKEASVEIDGENLDVAVVSGLSNAAKIIRDINSGMKSYNYIEVMACPGGCLGGGGQPLPTSSELRAKRSASFYVDDQKKKLRRAHENKDLIKMYETLNAKPGSLVAKKLFHRGFTKRRKK